MKEKKRGGGDNKPRDSMGIEEAVYDCTTLLEGVVEIRPHTA